MWHSAYDVRLRPETYGRVKHLAEEQHTTMQEIVARGVEALEREEFASGFQDDFAALHADSHAWANEKAERQELDHALGDGLVP